MLVPQLILVSIDFVEDEEQEQDIIMYLYPGSYSKGQETKTQETKYELGHVLSDSLTRDSPV